jgi:hypothetical protein
MDDPRDDPTQPLPLRPAFDLIARVRRIDKKLYGMKLFRRTRLGEGYVGHMILRDDEWAQIVPGLRAADVVIEYWDEA